MSGGRRERAKKSMPWTTTLLRTLRFRTTTTPSTTTVRKQGGDQEDVGVLVVPSAAAASTTATAPLKASRICYSGESDTTTWEDAVARLFVDAVAPSRSSSTSWEEERSLGINNLQHMRQRTNWDCGVTCLQMVAHWLASNDATTDFGEREDHRRDWMLKLAGTASIWTVDLAWILHNMMLEASQRNDFKDFSFLFCSTSLSVNEEFSDYNYYKEAFAKDRIRVLERFQRLGEIQDPPVLFQTSRQRLPLSRVVEFIQQSSCIGITLVDNQILKGNTGKPYTGHYVVLLGVSHDFIHVREAVQHDGASSHGDTRFCLVVSDPGSKQSESFYTPNHFDRAWRSPGTDDDIIFVVKSKSCMHNIMD